jgi:cell division protein FtsZ
MGGGTGTGAAPVIARLAKEQGVLTVGVITKPFHFEGTNRMRTAERGIDELQQFVDTLIIIPNQNLFRVANEKTTFADAFKMADDVLRSGVQGVTDLMVMPGLINLDFADIRTVMSEMGKAMMGTGDAEGEKRALEAAEAAISNPLLDDVSMKGARGILINITGGYDLTLYEVDEAANRIREEVDPEARIIFGSTFSEKMNGRMRVSVVATGIDAAAVQEKKQAFEEISAVKMAKKEPAFGGEGDLRVVSNSDASFMPSESNERNVASATANSVMLDSAREERKKSPSLFERLTGMKRFSSGKKEDYVVQQVSKPSLPPQKTHEEDLEIPAFLRRNS